MFVSDIACTLYRL